MKLTKADFDRSLQSESWLVKYTVPGSLARREVLAGATALRHYLRTQFPPKAKKTAPFWCFAHTVLDINLLIRALKNYKHCVEFNFVQGTSFALPSKAREEDVRIYWALKALEAAQEHKRPCVIQGLVITSAGEG